MSRKHEHGSHQSAILYSASPGIRRKSHAGTRGQQMSEREQHRGTTWGSLQLDWSRMALNN
eukprot:13170027-Alexandrium_andersonii.AAC.1